MPAIPPASTSPASAYDLEGFAEQLRPPAILADLIDPVTGDFRSLLRGAPLADAFAVEALRVQRGTGAAVRDTGNRFREITHVEPSAAEVVESMTREAFADAERAGVAQLETVTIDVDAGDPSQLNATITWRDLLAPPGEDSLRRLTLTR